MLGSNILRSPFELQRTNKNCETHSVMRYVTMQLKKTQSNTRER